MSSRQWYFWSASWGPERAPWANIWPSITGGDFPTLTAGAENAPGGISLVDTAGRESCILSGRDGAISLGSQGAGNGGNVALGGGAYAREENVRMIREASAVAVFLDAPMEELLLRCRREPNAHVRPNLQNESVFRRLYEERKPLYYRANFRGDTAGKPIEEVAHEVVRELGKAKILWEES